MKKTIIFLISLIIGNSLLSFNCCRKCNQKNEIVAYLSLPKDFGCPKDSSSGKINFLNCDKYFQGTFNVNKLLSNQLYLLSINGKIEHDSNKLLKKKLQVTADKKEGYSDFQSFQTDSFGNYSGTFYLELPCGYYDVKIFVKDKDNQYCEVLMNQTDIKFTIGK